MTEKDALYLRFLKSVQSQDGLKTALLSESALQEDCLLLRNVAIKGLIYG